MAEWLKETGVFLGENPVLLLFAVIALGFLLGEVRFPGGLRFGVAAVLFVGLGAGYAWPETVFPPVIAPLGLALLVYCLGLQAGPGFLRSFRSEGMALSLCLAASVGVLVAGCLFLVFGLGAPPALATGMFAGISTNTAALGAAGEAAQQLGADADAANQIILGYALHYPIGIAATLLLLHVLVTRFPPRDEAPRDEGAPPLPQTYEVEKTRPGGSPWTGASLAEAAELALSRYEDAEGRIDFVHPGTVLAPGCRVVAIARPEGHRKMEALVGRVSDAPLQVRWEGFEKARFFVSRKEVVGIPLRELRLDERGIVISRIRRGDVELPVAGNTRLQLGDRVRAVIRSGQEADVAGIFGNSLTTSTESGYMSFVVGIIAGMVLGLVPLPLPFLESPLRLGVAGGALVAGLVLGARGRTGPLVWHLPITVNLTLRQTGLLFFLAGAGLQAGAGLEAALPHAEAVWMLWGIGLMVLSQAVFLGSAALAFRGRTGFLLGALSAMQTQPGAHAYSLTRASAHSVNSAYAAIYPLALILKIILAQLLVLTI